MGGVNWLHVGALTALLAAGWALHVAKIDGDHKAETIGALQAAAVRDGQLIDAQAAALQSQQELAGAIHQIQTQTNETRTVLAKQAGDFRALKEHVRQSDALFDNWMRADLPGSVGLLYARPETTDPRAYRQTPGVPAGGVPAARPGGAAAGR